MALHLGDNFSNKPALNFLKAPSAEELLAQLQQLKIRYTIEGMYYADGFHVCWINPMHKILKASQLKKGNDK